MAKAHFVSGFKQPWAQGTMNTHRGANDRLTQPGKVFLAYLPCLPVHYFWLKRR